MSSHRKTQRLSHRSSASESAGGAGPAAAGILAAPPGLEELYAAVSAGNINWGTMANLNMKKVQEEGLGVALMALRAPPEPKKLSRKEYKKLYAQKAAEAATRRAARSSSRSRTPSSEVRRRRASLKKQPADGK
jgi:hypothetical protein